MCQLLLYSSDLKWATDSGQKTNKIESCEEDLKHELLPRRENWVHLYVKNHRALWATWKASLSNFNKGWAYRNGESLNKLFLQ